MGVRDEVLPAVVYLLLSELHGSQGRVEREGTAVVRGTHGAQTSLYVEFAHRSEVTEAVGLFVQLVRYRAVEVLAGEF